MKRAAINMATIAAAVLLAGCAQMRAHKGAVLDPQLASSIQPGVDNKTSVEKLIGRPTFVGQFTPNDWYYVAQDTHQFAFRNPRVSQENVYRVSFDAAGNVTNVQRTGKELIVGLDPVSRKTPTLGRQKSFFDELFGNIGTVGTGATPQQ